MYNLNVTLSLYIDTYLHIYTCLYNIHTYTFIYIYIYYLILSLSELFLTKYQIFYKQQQTGLNSAKNEIQLRCWFSSTLPLRGRIIVIVIVHGAEYQ